MEVRDVEDYIKRLDNIHKFKDRLIPEEDFEDLIEGIRIIAKARTFSRDLETIHDEDVLWSLAASCVMPWWPKSDLKKEQISKVRLEIFRDAARRNKINAFIPTRVFRKKRPSLLDFMIVHPDQPVLIVTIRDLIEEIGIEKTQAQIG